jgi:UDPglucose 6-dehydrogenase
MKKISIIGLWHLGMVNAVGFAEKGFYVTGIELDRERLKKLKNCIPPLFEPGLKEKMEKYMHVGLLKFTDDVRVAREADYVIIAYDSPVNEKDEVDISSISNAAKLLSVYLGDNTPLIITSQIPLGTSEVLEKFVHKKNIKWKSGVAYVPENLRLGIAIERFLHPDMIVIGSSDSKVEKQILSLYKDFETSKFTMDLKSAEMVKHALNTYLATAITFGNEISRLSEKLGANGVKVAKALKADKRVGKAPILPGLGFSGGTIARDVTQLLKFSKQKRYKSNLLISIVKSNEQTFTDVIDKLSKVLGNLKDKTVGILGLTYKPGTSTLRRSPAIKLIQLLNKKKARCLGYDPKVDNEELRKYSTLFKRVIDLDELAKKSDALLLVTEWPEFNKINYSQLAILMKRPVFIDTKNFIDPDVLKKSGFEYIGFGQ